MFADIALEQSINAGYTWLFYMLAAAHKTQVSTTVPGTCTNYMYVKCPTMSLNGNHFVNLSTGH